MSKKNINSNKFKEQEYEFVCPECGCTELIFACDASVYDRAHTITKDSAGRPLFKSYPEPHPPLTIIPGEVERCFCSRCKETWFSQFDIPLKPKNK